MHMHNQEEWVTVSQQELNEVESKEQRGITLQFMLSPADMPMAWRARSLKGEEIIAVEFKYLSDSEPKKMAAQSDGVTFEIGKNSKRIYKIILDFTKMKNSGTVILQTTESINHANGLNKRNSEVIQKFLSPDFAKPNIYNLLHA